MKYLRALAWAVAGAAIAGALVIPLYFYNEGYRVVMISPRETQIWTAARRYEVEDRFPGGEWALNQYLRCETRWFGSQQYEVWVIYRANRDVDVTGSKCW